MCGRYALYASDAQVASLFGLIDVPVLEPRYNIAPGQPLLAICQSRDDQERHARFFHWGLVPHWADDPAIGNSMINARGETADQKPAFRAAFARRRCLLPANGFYEWKSKGKGKSKQPMFISPDNDEPFGLAGLFEHWQDENGNELETVAILTTEPNKLVEPIHNRMPVIVSPADYATWLDPARTEQAKKLIKPASPEAWTAQAVCTHVNSPKNDGPRCIESVDEPPGLF